ncbi:MAG: hypothetical protein JXR46_08220 [Calditrichaceae bacterium]|nr:hypothetical protein [Calditrichaceae bacterium]MBN2709015.1 hypothetical protein [Calditrichaceae bacterium]RQV95333.1 MAG: hypothetical protein EH224_07915 [Calditrichota bacterium]
MKLITNGLYISFIILYMTLPLDAQDNLKNQLEVLIEKERRFSALKDSLNNLQSLDTSKEHNSAVAQDMADQVKNLQSQKNELYREILQIKSAIYDSEQSQPVWAEGVGEVILDESKPYEQNKRLVLSYARRDAMEKGGKLIVESMVRLEKFERTTEDGSEIKNKFIEEYRSIIESKGKVQVVDQDLSGDYGKVFTEETDGIKKLKVTVRLKMTSIDDFNPFIKEMKSL